MARAGRLATAAAIALIGGALLLPGLAVAASNPPGNNGTVRLDATPFDAAPDNEPHVDCTFQVDVYGYDEGDLDAQVTFEAHAPTLRPGGGSQVLLTDSVFIGEDDNSGGGSDAVLGATPASEEPGAGVGLACLGHAGADAPLEVGVAGHDRLLRPAQDPQRPARGRGRRPVLSIREVDLPLPPGGSAGASCRRLGADGPPGALYPAPGHGSGRQQRATASASMRRPAWRPATGTRSSSPWNSAPKSPSAGSRRTGAKP
jgi:hypothetical protein